MLSLLHPTRRTLPLCRRTLVLATWRSHQYHSSLPRRNVSTETGSLTKVEKIILDNIKATGPITFSNYIQFCLAHPTHGYYMNPENPVFGTRGDFITSPEISQVFGELLMVWFLSRWMSTSASAAPRPIRLVELGPGRGTLMADMLRVATQIKASRGAIKEVHLVETSLTLRAIQESTLRPLADTLGCTLVWHDMIEDVPEDAGVFTALIAHEFFDALPFRLVEKTAEGWREVLIASAEQRSSLPPPTEPSATVSDALKVALQDAQTATPIPTPLSSVLGIESNLTPPPPNESPLPSSTGTMPSSLAQNVTVPPEGQRFRYVLRPDALWEVDLLALTSPRFSKLPVGARAEISLESNKTARAIGRLLSPAIGGVQGEKQHVRRVDGGAALVVDYGDTKTFGDSFRGFKNHEIVDIFHRPGECDLTANVDFAYLSEAFAEQATPLGPLTQGAFLERMAIAQRVQSLIRSAATPERAQAIEDAAKRLVDPSGMGGEYKILGVVGRASDELPREIGEIYPFEGLAEVEPATKV